MDVDLVSEWAFVLGVKDEDLGALIRNGIEARKEQLFAATPRLHGLQLWVDGPRYNLLDEKGFVCWTDDHEQAISLCRLESILGPGAVRTLLKKEPIDPLAAVVAYAAIYRRIPKPVEKKEKTGHATKGASLSPEIFKNLLEDL